MKNKVSIFVYLLVFFANVTLAGEAEKQRLVTSLMYKPGLISQIESNAETIINEYVKALKNQSMTNDQIEKLSRIITPFFNATVTKGDVRQYFVDNLSVGDIKEVLVWLESPLGRKITQYEEETSNPKIFANIIALSEPLKSNTVRLNKLKNIDELTGGIEGAVRMAKNSQISLVIAMMPGLPKDQRISIESLKEEMKKDEESLREIITSQMLSYQLVSYKNIADDELDRYIAFLDTASARKYHKVTIDALDQSLVKANR